MTSAASPGEIPSHRRGNVGTVPCMKRVGPFLMTTPGSVPAR